MERISQPCSINSGYLIWLWWNVITPCIVVLCVFSFYYESISMRITATTVLHHGSSNSNTHLKHQQSAASVKPIEKYQHSHIPWNIQYAKNRSSTHDGAFVYLALGVQANTMNCPASIESLVKIAGWDEHVYLLTDKSDCFNEIEIASIATMDPEKLHIIPVHDHFDGINILDPNNKKIDLRRNRKKSFRVKTQLFDYIKDTEITTLAYIDCDILFGIPGCATDFITAGQPFVTPSTTAAITTTMTTTATAAINSDSTNQHTSNVDDIKNDHLHNIIQPQLQLSDSTYRSTTTNVLSSPPLLPPIQPNLKVTRAYKNEATGEVGMHCGTMVMHRTQSKQLLQLWREQMDLGEQEDDNDAFTAAYKKLLSKANINANINIKDKQEKVSMEAKVAAAATARNALNMMQVEEIHRNGLPTKFEYFFHLKIVETLYRIV